MDLAKIAKRLSLRTLSPKSLIGERKYVTILTNGCLPMNALTYLGLQVPAKPHTTYSV
jgi:hypothetical protein